jgi:hypothetical protein
MAFSLIADGRQSKELMLLAEEYNFLNAGPSFCGISLEKPTISSEADLRSANTSPVSRGETPPF